jgi:PII-like signaling protein
MDRRHPPAGSVRMVQPGGIGYGRICGQQAFNLDRVLPAVTEVIEIAQRLRPGVFDHVDEEDLAGVERAVGPVGVGT